MAKNQLRLPAFEIEQSPGKRIYTFACDGKLLPDFAAVTRVRRSTEGNLEGYQRAEVVAHIAEIRNYLESDGPLIPNSVVLAFDGRVKFIAAKGPRASQYCRMGELVIPLNPNWEESEKPGFVVDGQQRLAAVRDAEIDRFPMSMTAFITDDDQEQTEQFILVNSTKPLPRSLIYELLPNTRALLPTQLHRRRFPALLLEGLNLDETSPLHKMIQNPTTPEGVIKDNSILRMLENSLNEGVLYRFNHGTPEESDLEAMFRVLFAFWRAVEAVFPDAWGKQPRKSRLMHGAGVVSMGLVMDACCERYGRRRTPTVEQFTTDLTQLAKICRWTEGSWDFGPDQKRKWNEIQNTSKDVQLLANHLLGYYKRHIWGGTSSNGAKRSTQARMVF
ncbi:MAG: DGQHR domain-containing protein DpdB [Polyangiaceae bacterium]